MVSFVFPYSQSGTGTRAILAAGDNVFVTFGVTVASTDSYGFYGTGSGNSLNIQGTVSANAYAIALFSSTTAATNHRIEIGEGGYLNSFATAIALNGSDGRIINKGTIWADDTGIIITASNTATYTLTKVVNSGDISSGGTGIRNSGTNGLSLLNSGTITAGDYSWAVYSDQASNDNIVNTGTLSGGVYLGGGDYDLYDGSKGHLIVGNVSGGDGTDYIIGGGDTEYFTGDAGNDTLHGGGGADSLSGGNDSDYVYGDSGNDSVYGNAGNDYLYGGTGLDDIIGGTGDDYLAVDNVGDRVFEYVGEGTDYVYSSVSYMLEGGQEIEFLNYSAATSAAYLKGVKLTGNAFGQSINGGGGNDVLIGGGGADTLTGYGGNDTYVTDGGDAIVEAVGGGTDTIQSSASITLSANVERLLLTGSANLNGAGNALANVITGNTGNNSLSGLSGADTLSGGAGADKLSGGLGADSLTGGSGNDTFLFNAALAGGNIDTITDFRAVDDTIQLENAIFTAFGAAGQMAASAFASNTTGLAGDASDRIIYETDTGKLFYDADGTGSAGRTQFALLKTGLVLTSADFIIV
ncbi:calcium-binding protein [Pararhizobium sp.]|uniref:calcium-binding protein n=1 Tax=Pararhizobium sp. TaxID=1977563 RepID=UPI003D141910